MSKFPSINISQAERPGLLRRLAAILYDTLVLAGLVMVAAALLVIPLEAGLNIKIRNGQPLFQLYLIAVIFGYFGWSWVHGGQTLGMRAWRLLVLREDGNRIRWRDALLRFASALLSWAPCGLGFIWILFNTNRLAWHDRLSHTRLVILRREKQS